MNIAFRTDSSLSIGTGHVHRCLNLARKFKKKTNSCYFFLNDFSGNINNLVEKEFNIFTYPNKNFNYSNQKLNLLDANLTIKFIKKLKIDLIFLDHYLLDEKWEKKVSKFCKIVFLSDFINRKSFCDYYLNYNLAYENSLIKNNFFKKDCKKLIGLDYSIIKDLPYLKTFKKNKISIFMGGVDKKNFTSKLIKIFSDKFFSKFKIIVVLGIRNKKKLQIEKQIKKYRNFQIVKGNKKNLYSTFINSKLVVTSVGTTMFEHIVLGLNSVIIAQNNNQKRAAKSLSSLNILNFLNSGKDLNKYYFIKILNENNLQNKKKKFQSLIDTNGSNRIVNYFTNKDITNKARLKKVSYKDKYFLFKLANDPQVVKNSLNKKIVKFEDHNLWFEKIIKSKKTEIFIFLSEYNKIGQVRFDKLLNNKTYITYSVANEFRGKKIGLKMLKMALKKKIFGSTYYAVVRNINHPSNKIFQKLGFKLIKKNSQKKLNYYLKKT